MNPRWLLKMSQWSRNPPPLSRVLLVLGVVLACLGLFAFEHFFGWPEALTPNSVSRGAMPKLQ